jgi:peptidyl-prolyl cis-trans isomerase C
MRRAKRPLCVDTSGAHDAETFMRTLLIATALSGLLASTPLMAQDQAAPEDTGAPAADYDASTVLATVDGTEITLGNLVVLRSRLPQQYQEVPDEALFPGLLEQLIDQTLLAQSESSSQEEDPLEVKLLVENERRGALAAMAINDIIAEPLDDAQVQAAYDEMFANFQPQPEFNASHILVDSEEKANELKAQIDGGADFATLAKGDSMDGSAESGGELGWFGAGRMVPEFETAVMGMKPGEVTGPIQTQFGWHLIKLNETRESSHPPLEEARPQIEDQLRQQQVQQAIASLREGADISQSDVNVPPAAIRDTGILED